MPHLRLIRADVLKLWRRHTMIVLLGLAVVATVAVYYGVGIALHASDPAGHGAVGGVRAFGDSMGVLALMASVAGAIVGATAGGADIETGVFRDLVATGRSRTALFFARVPAAWVIVLGMLALAAAVAAVLAVTLDGPTPAPTLGDVFRGAGPALVAGGLSAAVCVGLAALTGSLGPVMGIVIAFQLGASPLLAQVEVLGDARLALPQVAITRLDGAEGLVAGLGLGAAVAIILAWGAVALGAGLWRTTTQEL